MVDWGVDAVEDVRLGCACEFIGLSKGEVLGGVDRPVSVLPAFASLQNLDVGKWSVSEIVHSVILGVFLELVGGLIKLSEHLSQKVHRLVLGKGVDAQLFLLQILDEVLRALI